MNAPGVSRLPAPKHSQLRTRFKAARGEDADGAMGQAGWLTERDFIAQLGGGR